MEKATKTLFLVVLLGCIFALNTYAAEPEEIYTAEQLNDVRNNLAGSYILMSDIDLSDTVWGEVYAGEYGTSGWEPIGSQASPFRGSFDGNGYTITGLFIDKPNVNEVGLFGNTAASATIEGLRLGDVNVTGKMDVGGLVGLNEGIITNCYVTGSVKGTAEEIGGLVGYHKNAGTITNSYSACAVEGTHFLGGLIGRNEAPISNSYATGDVYGILAGTSSAVGGLVGRNADGIINSYATGNVTGGSNVGGLIGYNWSDMNVEYSYATGAVEGTTKVGGLIGSINVNGTGTVLNSYYNSCTTGQTEDDSGNGEPKTSTEMVQTDTFIDWDFTNTWNINEWESYPRLKWSSHVPAPPAATAVTVSSASVELTYGGGPTTLTAAVEPVCAIQKVTWSTSNSDVATVDENGVVTPIGAGEATITATPVSGDVVGETAVTVGKKELTVSGTFTAGDKVYDGSTTAVIDASSLTLSGVVGGDNVELSTSAVFANKNVAENITVNLTSDNSLIGDDAGNYTLSLTGAPISTANITAMELTVINAAAQDKVYDGTADAIIDGAQLSGVVDGDSVTLEDHTVGIFAQATVGTGIGVTTNMTITGDDADNYTIAQPGLLTANITAKELTVINAVAQEKVYDRTTDADIINAELSGVVDGDSVTLENHTVGTFAQAAIGTGIGVTTNMTITGDDVENYTIAQPVLTADITTKELTIINAAAQDKVYDGTDNAVIGGAQLSGVVGSDDVTLGNHTVGTFAQAAIGTGIGVTTNMTITGDDAGNYTIAQPVLATANITAKGLTVINAEAQDKVYDGTADAIIDGAQLSGVVDGDSVTLGDHTMGVFAQAKVGTGIGVITYMTITGDDVENYTIAQPVLTADITTKELTIINAAAQNKIYDGTDNAVIGGAQLSGVVDGDSVTLGNHTVGTFAQAAIGTGIGVTTNMTITGDDADNYTIAQPVLSANITAKGLTVINAAAQDKVYDGTADADIINAELSGVVDGDDVTLGNHTVGTFAQATIGTDIGVTTNMTITGDDAGNYTIAQPVLATANITAKELTVINAEAQDKVYDGTADADIINAELSGVVDGDSVTLENNDAGTFAQATVGTGIEVTTNMTITGDDAGNYTIAQPVLSADITAKELTIGGTFTAEDKIYDGNTTVVIDDSDLTLTGVVDGDSVVLNAAAAFADANAADYIVVSLTDASSISGEDSGNYSLSLLGAPTTTADITPPPSDSKAITDFSLEAFEPDIQAVIDEGAKTITMEVPFGTDVTALVPTIEHTGADIIPASGVVQDFTNPVTYEVTAENNTTAVYTVTMSVALPSNEACLTNLVISSGILNPAFVPDIQAYTADVANSTADITVTSTAAHPGASIEVNMTAVVSGEASQAIALNVGVNTINIIVTAEDGTERIYEVTVNRASSDSDNDDDRDNDDDNDRNTSISEPEPTTSSNITINVNGNSITSAASVDSETGTVTAVLNESAINNALTESQDDGQGVDTVDIKIPKTTGANYYVTELPATVLTGNNTTRIEINSELGTITLPGNMLGDEGAYGIDNVGLSIGTVDKSAIDEKVRTQIGDKPVIELKLKSKEGTISWNNPDAPVTVSIPYTPTEKELSDPEHITVWYIDGEGNVIEVPTGRYNPVTGMVTFSTTHFSNYAVVYVTKTFDDLENAAWGKKSIEVLASKGVMKGVSEKEFEPQSNITRADFLYSLIRTLGVEARFDGNFDDISKDDYYYKEIGIAQRMGITKGTGNNKFNPEESITRQDMMVLTERALRMFKRIEAQGAASDLDKFADKSLIADYAVNSVASVVKEGLIVGSGDGVNPLGNTTRAETAVFLYRIYNK